MRDHDALSDLIRRGRRRQVCQALLTASSLAVAFALSGGILLLVLGTQILNWYWLAALFAGSLALTFYRLRKRIASEYKVAQEIDGRLGFHDALSTAYFFARNRDRTSAPDDLIVQQRERAAELARSADLGRGLPFFPPKTLYVNAALAVLACGMFGLRYGIQRNLDLKSSLVKIGFEGFLGSSRGELAQAKRGRLEDAQTAGEKETAEGKSAADQTNRQDALNGADNQSESDLYKGADAKKQAKGSGEGESKDGDDLSEMADKQESPEGKDGGDNSSSASENAPQTGKQAQNGKNANGSGNDGDNQSLGDKLRDALANMMAKLKKESKPSGSQKSSGSQSAQKKNQPADGSSKPENASQADSNSEGESQGQQQQGGTEQSAQGKSQGNSSDRPNSPDGKSGIGNQDGDKRAREAAELAAMGKISEIIGKRAANITGEVMVEVSSGKQQLKTQYSQKNAAHVDAGGEINRDEVPIAYQQYVQQYFDEIRKSEGKPVDRAKPAATTPAK